jgi:adenylate kinase
LLRDEVKRMPALAMVISRCIHEGKMVPDDIIIPLIEARIKQSDCKVNGWVMEGFP